MDLYCVDFIKNVSFGRYVARLHLPAMTVGDSALSRQKTHHWFDKITNEIAYKPLARSDNYLNWRDFL